jgi:hypothetical protein
MKALATLIDDVVIGAFMFPEDKPVYMNGHWWAILGAHLARTDGVDIELVAYTATSGGPPSTPSKRGLTFHLGCISILKELGSRGA